ncbi:MAG: hypothetical protein J5379_09405 [Clostridiales bacterium]|nr:hypothetical protein [Clostridiales bacterium]
MIEIKKSHFYTIVISTGILFLIFLFVRIDALHLAKKNYKDLCTETTWGKVISYKTTTGTRRNMIIKETVKYTFEVDGRTIEGSYSARTLGGKYTEWGADYNKPVLVHYNPDNVHQNYFGNHCEPVDEAETSLLIAIFHLVFWLLFSIAIYMGQRHFWELEEDAKVLQDYRRYG